jgi:hypothetical protein
MRQNTSAPRYVQAPNRYPLPVLVRFPYDLPNLFIYPKEIHPKSFKQHPNPTNNPFQGVETGEFTSIFGLFLGDTGLFVDSIKFGMKSFKHF